MGNILSTRLSSTATGEDEKRSKVQSAGATLFHRIGKVFALGMHRDLQCTLPRFETQETSWIGERFVKQFMDDLSSMLCVSVKKSHGAGGKVHTSLLKFVALVFLATYIHGFFVQPLLVSPDISRVTISPPI